MAEEYRYMGDESWRDRGNCREADPEIFFPGRGESVAEAKAICAKCSVRAECLEYALINVERSGVWGGTSEKERRALRPQRRLALLS